MGAAPRPALVAVLALAVTIAWCALFPHRLTDGDSTLFAAIAGEMAAGGSEVWLAPQWASQGSDACFHGHPPGTMWAMAAVGLLGLGAGQAALVANALWLALLLYSLWILGGKRLPSRRTGLGVLACAVFLLTYPVWKYVVRAGLEIPFAACVTACVAATRSPSRMATVWLALAFAGAIFTRGIFGMAVPFVLLADTLLTRPHSLHYRARLVVGLLLGAILAALYDLGHTSVAGHGFWKAYTEMQVMPSLVPGGTVHSEESSTPLYYLGRLFLYGLPWWLVAGAALASRRKHGEVLRNVYPALAWILIFLLAIALIPRQGSRYLFAAWPALAWLTAESLRHWWLGLAEPERKGIAVGVCLLVPALTIGKTLLTQRDTWWRAAEGLHELRAELEEQDIIPPPVYGPFKAHDDRMKQFLRLHLGSMAYRAPEDGVPPPGSWRLVLEGDPDFDSSEAVLFTDLFTLLPAD